MTQKRLSQAHRRILRFLSHTGAQAMTSGQVGQYVGKQSTTGRPRRAEWATPKLTHLAAMGLVYCHGTMGWTLTRKGREWVDTERSESHAEQA